jgi:hypothetical protein
MITPGNVAFGPRDLLIGHAVHEFPPFDHLMNPGNGSTSAISRSPPQQQHFLEHPIAVAFQKKVPPQPVWTKRETEVPTSLDS